MRGLTVLTDPACRLCRFVAGWIAGQRQLVPVTLVPVGSAEARRLFPALDHDGATRREITVVGDAGQVYVGQTAWVVVLWALADHRALAHRMSTPAGRRLARTAVLGVAKYREAAVAHHQDVPKRPRSLALPLGPPRGAPLAGRSGAESRTAWVYDGQGGWTVRGEGPFAGPVRDETPGCAEGCPPPG
ncbi:DCC1-like thiol-disulfide oxidoreductase family protein [Streptomyces sp. NRRL F-5123]|uniref:DCC1-like thiol-disulfide oxidoreductase family protein n=1 Tax=Streptomyces sp. NRRL F-5123 TaxID=1463856 RepID=UPI001F18526F|nr:DCC1-like thiol-disulfide oxidoreductase family protein [Streptomyces sp. NRRL F-5123]